MRNLLFLVTVLAAFISRAETIEFKLQTDDQACKGLSQVVVSQDKTILYRAEVPMNGTGQVQLLTGNFQIEASNSKDCFFQDVIQISDLPNKLVTLKLEKSTRKTASGDGSDTTCGWATFGCSGNLYPHDGNINMGKPNIYFANKDEGKFKFKFSGDNFGLLSSVPSFKDKEISGELRKGSIYSENVWYPYLSYEARISDSSFQDANGFCGTKKEIYKFMLEGLVKYDFPNEARSDFASSWSVKLPEATRYCVFPQANAQLDKAAPFEITYEDKSQVETERLFYLVVPQDFKGKRIPAKENRFTDKPKSLWKHYTRTLIPKRAYLYEWSVGYLFE